MNDWRADGWAAYERDLLVQQEEEAQALRRLAQVNPQDAQVLARALGHDVRDILPHDNVSRNLF